MSPSFVYNYCMTSAQPPAVVSDLTATTFFTRTYDEAHALLVDSRDYVRMARGVRWQGPSLTLAHTLETLRLTTRVAHIMAWLLAQRAVHACEITRAEAATEKYRLGGRDVCLATGGESDDKLPPPLRNLLDRSHGLYKRISRLDEMVGRDAA